MTITRNFKLCLNAGTQNAPYINVNQYDEGEQWIFDLYTEGGQKFTPSTGAIIGIKSDGNAILNSGTVNSDGQVVITETQQMTAASGLAVFELLIEGETHGTANFIVNVERRPSDDAEFSDSDLSMLQEAIDAAEVINEILDEGGDPSEIIAENVNAWLDNHPEATTTVLDGAITAPKINNSLWDKLLVSEEASGAVASFDDGADDVPVSSLKVALEPIQLGSGDPSPSNIRPIVAANGKNLLNSAFCVNRTNKGITTVLNADGSITLTGTADGSSRYWNATDTLALTLPIGTYTLSPSNMRIEKVGGGTSYGTFTLAEPTTYQNVYFTLTSGTTYNTTVYPQLERGSSASAYQPYQGIMVANAGINQWDEEYQFGYYDANGIFHARTTQGEIASKNMIRVAPNTTYYFHIGSSVNRYVCYYDANGIIISQSGLGGSDTAFTTPNNCHFINFNTGANYGTTYNNDISINYPSTITDYHAYVGNSYPYSLEQTVYGGSVDLATGVLTVTHGFADMGSLTWVYDSTRTCFYTVLAGMKTFAPGDLATYVCDSYQTIAPSYSSGNEQNNTIWARVNETTFRVRDTSYTVAADFKAAVSGHQLVYELATPTTVQLTPQEIKTLLGYNNISSTGTVEVIYHADTKLYIDKRIAELG